MKNLDLLIPKTPEAKDTFTWATVHSTDPLRIRFDGESAPMNGSPESLVNVLETGDRVWTQMHGRRVFVVGRAGGDPLATTTEWTTPTFTNGWTNVAFRRKPQYRLFGGAVRLRGSATGGTKDAAIFTLPAGHRPDETITFPLVNGDGQLEVHPDGVVKTYFASVETISLNVVNFIPDQ